jgi:hypothetical protein
MRNGDVINFRDWRTSHRPGVAFDANVIDADV